MSPTHTTAEELDVVAELRGKYTGKTVLRAAKEIETLRKAETIFLAHISRIEAELAAAEDDMLGQELLQLAIESGPDHLDQMISILSQLKKQTEA